MADTATDGAVDTYGYDGAGHMITHVTRNGLSVTWIYDALGELLTRRMAGLTPRNYASSSWP